MKDEIKSEILLKKSFWVYLAWVPLKKPLESLFEQFPTY